MARRRRDRWSLGPALSLSEAARGSPEFNLASPAPVLAWVQLPDRTLEVEARALAWTDRAVLVEWGFGQAAESSWVWRDAVRASATVDTPTSPRLAGEQMRRHGGPIRPL